MQSLSKTFQAPDYRLWLFLLIALVAVPAAQAQLEVQMTANPTTVAPGERLQLEILISNPGGSGVDDVSFESVFPAGLDPLSIALISGTCPSLVGSSGTCNETEPMMWSLGTIGAGESVTLEVPARVATATAGGTTITLDGAASDLGGIIATASVNLEVEDDLIYDLVLAEGSDPVLNGSELTYTLAYSLLDFTPVTDTRLRLVIPPDTTFVSASGTPNVGGGEVSWDLGFLNPGVSGTQTVTVQLGPSATIGSTLVAAAIIESVADTSQRLLAEAGSSVAAAVPLNLSITTTPDLATVNEMLNVEFTIANPGTQSRSGVFLTVRYPEWLASHPQTVNDGSCPSIFGSSGTCDAGEPVTWNIGTIAAGGTVTVDLNPFVSSQAIDGRLTSLFSVVSDAQGSTTRMIETLTTDSSLRFDVALAEDSDPVATGAALNYEISYAMLDANPVTESRLRFALPEGVALLAASDGGVDAGSEVSWDLGFLAPGESGTREVSVSLDAGVEAGDVLLAEAVIESVAEPSERQRSEAATSVADGVPLNFSIATNPALASGSELVNIELTVANPGLVDRSGVNLSVRYPQDLSPQTLAMIDGSCPSIFGASGTCNAGEPVSWDLGTIAAGDARTVDLTPFVPSSPVDGRLVNLFAVIEDAQGAALNRMETLILDDDLFYDLSLAEDSDPVAAGGRLEYTLTYALRDVSPVTDTRLRFRLPMGTSLVAASDGGVENAGDVIWDLGFVLPGETGRVTVSVDLGVGLVAGDIVNGRATIEAVSDPSQRQRAEATTPVAVDVPLVFSVATTPGLSAAGEITDIEFTVANPGAFDRSGVSLRVRYPQNLSPQTLALIDGTCPSIFGASSSCDSGEPVTFDLGTIEAGGAKTVDLAPQPGGASSDGQLINLFSVLRDAEGAELNRLDTLIVDSTPVFDLALAEDADPVEGNQQITYTATFSLLGGTAVTPSSLSFTLPQDTTFISASDGGNFDGTNVTWGLGFLTPGAGGRRQVTVGVPLGTSDGSSIEAEARIESLDNPADRMIAQAVTEVVADAAISLSVLSDPNPVSNGDTLGLEFQVTNNSPFDRAGFSLRVRYPEDLAALSQTLISGVCPSVVGSSSTCNRAELVLWDLGLIPAGGSITAVLPPVVSTTVDGELINFFAQVTEASGARAQALETIRVGAPESIDNDSDGVPNEVDNCVDLANPNQRDEDYDGFGNLCDPDINNDFIVNVIDLGLFRTLFFSDDRVADFNSDGTVNAIDLGILKTFFFLPPGPSGVVVRTAE